MDDIRDSMGKLTIRSASSGALQTSFERYRERVGTLLTPEGLADELTRLNAAFGTPRDRTPDMMRVLANEWFKALSCYGRKTVHTAIDRAIATSKFWPAIAEVRALCREDDDGWQDALGLKEEPRRLADHAASVDGQFCREGRTVAEEIAYRAAQVKAMKAQHAYTPALDYEPPTEPPKPASRELWVSDELRAHAKKHGYWHGET